MNFRNRHLHSALFASLITLVAPFAPAAARAQWGVSLDVDGVLAVSEPEASEFGPGGSVGLGVYRAFTPWLLVGARARGTLLSDGPAPTDVTLANRGVGGLATVGPSLRVRPLAVLGDGSGPFLEGSAGAALTGNLARVSVEAGVGWLFGAGFVAIGPTVRYLQILQQQGGLRESDARIVMIGLEGTLFEAPAPVEPSRVVEDPDFDGDGILNADDACPRVPEDRDGFEDADGCPDRDNDRDGIYDADDRCRDVAEDVDGFEDADGCPDPDDDGDGILDGVDACPRDAEIVNGVEDEDGCPDEGLVTLVGDRVVLEDHVLFAFGDARVRSAARPVVRALARLVLNHPEWVRVRIEGHADVRGSDAVNQALTARRAEKVRDALVEAGVPAALLTAAGFGRSRPRDEGATDAAHARNRRVEFVVETVAPEAQP